MRTLLVLALIFCAQYAKAQVVCTDAAPCDPVNCNLPDCACSGTRPALDLADTPQIVYLSFDDAITVDASTKFYTSLFNGTFTNPNGCPIRATHFLTHAYTDYSLAQLYWSQGHEMATHSITHLSNDSYWEFLDEQQWIDEISGMKEMAVMYGNIPADDIIGMRAPFLQGGGNEQFQMMEDIGLVYDSTMPSRKFGYDNLDDGLWPYSLDYENTMDCQITPCPTCSFPNTWVQPLLDLEDNWFGSDPQNPDLGRPCSMLDSCVTPIATVDEVYDMLMRNFNRTYYGNTRAPMGLYMHAAWFYSGEYHYEGYVRFLETITDNSTYPDVWVLPVKAGIAYRKDPKTNDEILQNGYEPFDATCMSEWPAYNCDSTVNCEYKDVHYEGLDVFSIYMKICCPADNVNCCPPTYPWLRNLDACFAYSCSSAAKCHEVEATLQEGLCSLLNSAALCNSCSQGRQNRTFQHAYYKT